jgi:GT2 family glycosyltransferase/2-polyprenyl-3-methyl-5-hydroxy-6-metoxy-1,4-benzoquinol methylase
VESLVKYTDLTDKEVLIVANGCTDGTREYVESLGEPFRLLWSDNALGYAGANNLGVTAARGEHVVLLNNDTILLEQPKDEWIRILYEPFKNPWLGAGITGPLKGFSDPAGREFLVFFCVMIKKEVFTRTGLLDEQFNPGGGEDTALCIEAEKFGYKVLAVPQGAPTKAEGGLMIGNFPIYHAGEGTMKHDPEWPKKFQRNALKLAKKYNPAWYQWRLGNTYERAVFSKDDKIEFEKYPRERVRYEWAAKNVTGRRVLEIGCSSGYALKFLPADVEYTGADYDEAVLEFARDNFPQGEFIQANLEEEWELGDWDTIIAFEVLEHLSNGRELAQELKRHCRCLLASMPYNEPKGFWGGHHKLHQLTEKDFPGFRYKYVSLDGRFLNMPDTELKIMVDGVPKSESLMLLKWQVDQEPHVLAMVPTKGRYDSTLPLTLMSIIMQTRLPDALIIFDDNEQPIDLRDRPVYRYLLQMLDRKGVKWQFIFGKKLGQHHCHETSQTMAEDLIWRLDDDNMPEPNALETLLGKMRDDIGAVAGLVPIPPGSMSAQQKALIAEIDGPNAQWGFGLARDIEAEHLHSTFLYRRNLAHYDLSLSKVAHREETIFTHELFRLGYKLIVTPDAVTWHLRNPEGGIRTGDPALWAHDEEIFEHYLKKWGIERKPSKLFYLDNGLGDHIIFKSLLPEIKQKCNPTIACCYPDIFEGENVISLAEAQARGTTPDNHNIYRWMALRSWKRSLVDAFREMCA